MNGDSPLTALPHELRIRILTFLRLPDLWHVAACSRWWRGFVPSIPYLWVEVDFFEAQWKSSRLWGSRSTDFDTTRTISRAELNEKRRALVGLKMGLSAPTSAVPSASLRPPGIGDAAEFPALESAGVQDGRVLLTRTRVNLAKVGDRLVTALFSTPESTTATNDTSSLPPFALHQAVLEKVLSVGLGSTRVSRRSVLAVLKGCPNLRQLNLLGAECKLTNEDIAAFRGRVVFGRDSPNIPIPRTLVLVGLVGALMLDVRPPDSLARGITSSSDLPHLVVGSATMWPDPQPWLRLQATDSVSTTQERHVNKDISWGNLDVPDDSTGFIRPVCHTCIGVTPRLTVKSLTDRCKCPICARVIHTCFRPSRRREEVEPLKIPGRGITLPRLSTGASVPADGSFVSECRGVDCAGCGRVGICAGCSSALTHAAMVLSNESPEDNFESPKWSVEYATWLLETVEASRLLGRFCDGFQCGKWFCRSCLNYLSKFRKARMCEQCYSRSTPGFVDNFADDDDY
ncbi:hypothetical protein M427DRAFT_222450 [Gonapodya prolifera JEL478]|uniref:F-box domain-containing protein n=1 Tax=Gonapodya prolifera (strain JEL478) TaxID=1344416 RepID=A0A139AMY3_GONPJ|nr:hypothetical protein M427DRAFT_222450 [Gonapodya prolifera JEL478]|eukprot:KXS18121.1 hypothetical protein M427DRAFT_222450 [Gonapodya prolifera JEL478]